jgi:hypothetical protein
MTILYALIAMCILFYLAIGIGTQIKVNPKLNFFDAIRYVIMVSTITIMIMFVICGGLTHHIMSTKNPKYKYVLYCLKVNLACLKCMPVFSSVVSKFVIDEFHKIKAPVRNVKNECSRYVLNVLRVSYI